MLAAKAGIERIAEMKTEENEIAQTRRLITRRI